MAPEPVEITEEERAASLLDAQEKAASLFEEIERDLIRPGVSEAELSKEIHELAAKRQYVASPARTLFLWKMSSVHILIPFHNDLSSLESP